MIYRKLERVDFLRLKDDFRKDFPELEHLDSEELGDRLYDAGIEFYTEKNVKKSSILVRLTLPFAVLVFVLLWCFLPLNYIVTGIWGYGFKKTNWLFDWFENLDLL